MSIQVAIHHVTRYRYDRLIQLGARPFACVRPALPHQDSLLQPDRRAEGPFPQLAAGSPVQLLARIVVPEKTDHFSVAVDLAVELDVINPFDFFLEPEAEQFPFSYSPELKAELEPYLRTKDCGVRFDDYVAEIPRGPKQTTAFLFELNAKLSQQISYLIRMVPGIQTPDETLKNGSGSCRDTSWLLVQILRHMVWRRALPPAI